ncbi:PilZ domain-containing protein [Vibrio hippocampi]|uniref:PilZ domain-containing protein n=1 Tax=Vibrio hippocampi TaxID=654686 RepID=A0ABN8DF19_9VIBR|nr:PilZ domain-containing protein [Vibrio hippocampi]CAH0525559.1 hypothetical protein VHP8226_01086 [Vibrio hippocampi]
MKQNDFFTVRAPLKTNIKPLAVGEPTPSFEDYLAQIPAPFAASSEFSALEQQNDAATHELNQHNLRHVAQLIEQQNSKLNLLLNYLISQQDQAEFRHTATQFGAGELTYRANHTLQTGQFAEVKLFLDHPPAGIYCIGEVSHIKEHQDQFDITIRFVHILEEHQDMLIKAALHQQQKLLRQRSLDREK